MTEPAKEIEPVHRMVGARIEHMRSMLGWTQEQLAEKVGELGRTSIANIEAGRQRLLLDDIERFARAFGCTPKALLRGIWT